MTSLVSRRWLSILILSIVSGEGTRTPSLANRPQTSCDHPHGAPYIPSGTRSDTLTSSLKSSLILSYHGLFSSARASYIQSPSEAYHIGKEAPSMRSASTIGDSVKLPLPYPNAISFSGLNKCNLLITIKHYTGTSNLQQKVSTEYAET